MEALAAVQAQVAVILDQLRTLSERTDSHGTTLQSAGNISNINGVVVELQRKIQLLDAKDFHDKPQVHTKQQYLIHPKDVRVDDFYGDLDKFRDWLDDAIGYISIIDAALGKMLNDIAEGPKDLDLENLELTFGQARIDEINIQVHGFLRMKFKKNSKIWLKTRKNNQGLLSRKAMIEKYDPLSGASKLDLHRNIHVMRRVIKLRDATGAIEDWEVRYNLYMAHTGK